MSVAAGVHLVICSVDWSDPLCFLTISKAWTLYKHQTSSNYTLCWFHFSTVFLRSHLLYI